MYYILWWTYRKYLIKTEGYVSDQSFIAKSSVPQGSRYEHLLFLRISKDIVETVHNTGTKLLQFADDTRFYKVVNNDQDRSQLQLAFDNLVRWSHNNRIKLNPSKLISVTYFVKRQLIYSSQYYLGNEWILKKDTTRDLGIMFDSKLTDKLKVNKIYGLSYRFKRKIRSPGIMSRLLYIYIMPIIDYCSVVWSQGRIGQELRLERILHQITRILFHITGNISPRSPIYIAMSNSNSLRQLFDTTASTQAIKN